jgi:hypothetical protein
VRFENQKYFLSLSKNAVVFYNASEINAADVGLTQGSILQLLHLELQLQAL